MSTSTEAYDPSARCAGTSPRGARGGMLNQSAALASGSGGFTPPRAKIASTSAAL